MSNIRKQSSSRFVRRGRRSDRRGRQLGIETLERRDCPAVMFDFDGGVLRVTGDDGPNLIEIVKQPDGVVEVTGDGEQRRFEGVKGIVARTGDGDDQFRGKIILWVRDSERLPDTLPFMLDLNTGAGNDTTRIDDGLITFRDLNDVRGLADVRVDLGTGADNLLVAFNNTPNVSLGVISADGGDIVEAPILINVCQHPNGSSFACGLRASLQLGGGDNDVEVRTENFDKVDLDVVALGGGNEVKINQGWGNWEISPGRTLPQNPTSHTNLMLTGDRNKVGFETQGYPEVDLVAETGTSSVIAILIGMLIPAVQ